MTQTIETPDWNRLAPWVTRRLSLLDGRLHAPTPKETEALAHALNQCAQAVDAATALRDLLSGLLRQAGLNDPAVKPKLLELGFEIVANTPEQFTAYQAAEFARWSKLIQSRNIKAD